MANNSEYREFFTRSVQVNSGGKKDQETGFPVSYLVNNVSKFNRFLKGHFPSENVFIKLFKSIAFKLNSEDTATETEQGLVSQTTQAEYNAGTNTDSNGFALVPKPSFIKVSLDALSLLITNLTTVVNGHTTTLNNISKNLLNSFVVTNSVGTTETDLIIYSLPIANFNTNGDKIILKGVWNVETLNTDQRRCSVKMDIYGSGNIFTALTALSGVKHLVADIIVIRESDTKIRIQYKYSTLDANGLLFDSSEVVGNLSTTVTNLTTFSNIEIKMTGRNQTSSAPVSSVYLGIKTEKQS